jgi:hypothetical protein
MANNSKPWWYTFAKIGEAVGAGVKVFSGVAQIVPVPQVQLVGTLLAAAEGPITAEAEKGIKEADSK